MVKLTGVLSWHASTRHKELMTPAQRFFYDRLRMPVHHTLPASRAAGYQPPYPRGEKMFFTRMGFYPDG